MSDITLINNDYKNVVLPNNSIIVIDPPFNIGYHYKNYKDKLNEEVYFNELADLIRNREAVVIHYPEALHKLSIKLGYSPIRVVSWVYNSNTGRQHRDIAFYNIKPNFKQVIQPYKNINDKRIKERIAKGIVGGGYMTGLMLIKLKMLVRKTLLTHALCH